MNRPTTAYWILTSRKAEPKCEGPTSYTSTMAARGARLHLSALSPAQKVTVSFILFPQLSFVFIYFK